VHALREAPSAPTPADSAGGERGRLPHSEHPGSLACRKSGTASSWSSPSSSLVCLAVLVRPAPAVSALSDPPTAEGGMRPDERPLSDGWGAWVSEGGRGHRGRAPSHQRRRGRQAPTGQPPRCTRIRCCAGSSTGSGGGVARYRVVNGPAV